MTHSEHVILETPRLILRRFRDEDLDELFQLYCDPEIIKYIPDAPRSLEETRAEMEWHMQGHPEDTRLGLWATFYKESGRFIGRCGLLPWTIDEKNEVEVAFTIVRSCWGQGLATEAAQAILRYGFDSLRLNRLICLIDAENSGSRRVAEKIGMRFEREAHDEMGPFLLYSIVKV